MDALRFYGGTNLGGKPRLSYINLVLELNPITPFQQPKTTSDQPKPTPTSSTTHDHQHSKHVSQDLCNYHQSSHLCSETKNPNSNTKTLKTCNPTILPNARLWNLEPYSLQNKINNPSQQLSHPKPIFDPTHTKPQIQICKTHTARSEIQEAITDLSMPLLASTNLHLWALMTAITHESMPPLLRRIQRHPPWYFFSVLLV